MTERNPYAPPQAEVRDAAAASPTKGTLATRTLRLAGAIIDSVASAVFVVPFMVYTGDCSRDLRRAVIRSDFARKLRFVRGAAGVSVGDATADNDEMPTLARTLGLRYGTLAIGPVATAAVLVLNGAMLDIPIVFGLIDSALISGATDGVCAT